MAIAAVLELTEVYLEGVDHALDVLLLVLEAGDQ